VALEALTGYYFLLNANVFPPVQGAGVCLVVFLRCLPSPRPYHESDGQVHRQSPPRFSFGSMQNFPFWPQVPEYFAHLWQSTISGALGPRWWAPSQVMRIAAHYPM